MKKKLLPLAMLAGLAGAAGEAQAVHLNPSVLDQPYLGNKKREKINKVSQKKRRKQARRGRNQ